MARGHITWFYNGEAIGSVRNRAAVSDVPLTMRMSLVGDQNREMNKTLFHLRLAAWIRPEQGKVRHQRPVVAEQRVLRRLLELSLLTRGW